MVSPVLALATITTAGLAKGGREEGRGRGRDEGMDRRRKEEEGGREGR